MLSVRLSTGSTNTELDVKEEVKPVAERDIVTTFEAIENNLTEMRIRLSLVPGTLATTLLVIMPNIFRREGAA